MKKFGILSPCGTGNLGDETTVAVLIREIHARFPHAEIYGLTTNPTDTSRRHGITAYPARSGVRIGKSNNPPNHASRSRPGPDMSAAKAQLKRALKKLPFFFSCLKWLQGMPAHLASFSRELPFLAHSFKRVRGTDLLIVAGSGQLCDNFFGIWGFPYTLLKWAVIGRLAGAELAFVSCGAGPIDARLSKLFFRFALQLADYRSFRDEASRTLIEKIGIRHNDPVTPDLVFGLNLPADENGGRQSRIVAINPFPYCDGRYWPTANPDAYSSYVTRLANSVSWIIKHNHTVLFFPTQVRSDTLVIDDVKRILARDMTALLDRHLLVAPIGTANDLIDQLRQADLVIASRFHGVLISFLLNKPVLALSHHPKVTSLMQDMGQSEYLLDVDTFDVQSVARKLLSIESNTKAVKQQIRTNVTANRAKLETQYCQLFRIQLREAETAASPASPNCRPCMH